VCFLPSASTVQQRLVRLYDVRFSYCDEAQPPGQFVQKDCRKSVHAGEKRLQPSSSVCLRPSTSEAGRKNGTHVLWSILRRTAAAILPMPSLPPENESFTLVTILFPLRRRHQMRRMWGGEGKPKW
jgi:hypothetical protein